MSTATFALPSPGKFAAVVFPVLFGLVLPVVLAVAIALSGERTHDAEKAAALMLLLPFAAGAFAWSVRNREVALLDDGRVQVRRWPWPKRASRSEFDLAQARVVDLDQEPGLRPGIKLAGARMPGFASGQFWLKDKRRAYVMLGDRPRALLLPRHDGMAWLLGVAKPDDLLAALRPRG